MTEPRTIDAYTHTHIYQGRRADVQFPIGRIVMMMGDVVAPSDDIIQCGQFDLWIFESSELADYWHKVIRK